MVSDAPEHCSGAESNHPVFLHFELPAQGCSTPQTGTPVCGDRNDISWVTLYTTPETALVRGVLAEVLANRVGDVACRSGEGPPGIIHGRGFRIHAFRDDASIPLACAQDVERLFASLLQVHVVGNAP